VNPAKRREPGGHRPGAPAGRSTEPWADHLGRALSYYTVIR